ncbi:hypothetical protein OC844_004047 [Tilletia horrida]|nr:hypothetical protein OC844_004047 [Tilletia horrida]
MSASSSASPVVLYDILPDTTQPHRRPYALLPNPWIARLVLKAKQIPFVVRPITIAQLRASGPGSFWHRLGDALGTHGRPLIPIIEHNGRLVGDNMTIADYLDRQFPHSPSAYLPELTGEQAASARNQTAYELAYHTARQSRNLAISGHADLVYVQLTERFDPEQREWMRSDEKIGAPGAWQQILNKNRADAIAETRVFLRMYFSILNPLPHPRVEGTSPASDPSALASLISQPDRSRVGGSEEEVQPRLFLSSPTQPGFLDFTMFGWFLFTYINDRPLNEAIWAESSEPARAWLEHEYKAGHDRLQGEQRKQGHWAGDIPLVGVPQWAERMLSLYDDYTRKIVAGEVIEGEPTSL